LSTTSTSNTKYGFKEGTSMASPMVAGAAALAFAANPKATPAQVQKALEVTAKDLGAKGKDDYYGYGRIDAYAAAVYVSVTGITHDTFKGVGKAINCSVKTTLPLPKNASWKWQVVSGPGTISTTGVLTPTGPGTIKIKASLAENPQVFTTKEIQTAPQITYKTHVQNVGWQNAVEVGKVSGTSGKALRLEGLIIDLKNTTGFSGGIEYSTHIESIGWQKARKQGELSGTTGKSLRLEAMTLKLTGDLSKNYDIYYRVHAEKVGWLAWAKNGERAGTAGNALRLEAMQIVLLFKGSPAPSNSYGSIKTAAGAPRYIDPTIASNGLAYNATVHVQNKGDIKYGNKAKGTTYIGTTGKSLRLEALYLKLPANAPYKGGIEYSTHIQNIGWQKAVQNGKLSGTKGKSLRLEAVTIKLTGEMAKHYDIYYRSHVQNIGWTGWAKNGQQCGSAGYS
jgi:uncharacterized protein YjdB